MKNITGALGTAAFLMAVLALTLGDFNRTVGLLQARLDHSESRLLQAGPPLPNMEDLHHDIMAPSVQVNARGSVGGGTLLCSRENHTYVVTAYHVVQKIVVADRNGESRESVDVTIYDGRGLETDKIKGDIMAWNEKKDLALLRLRTVRDLPNVARLASRTALRSIRVFTPLYAVGCPLGHDPLPTLGEVVMLHKEVNGEKFWMMNAPTIFGNSGGGIFHRETRELIGVSVMVCTYEGAVATPVPHLGILVSMEAVYDWLDELHYRFIYDPGCPVAACEAFPAGSTRATAFPR
jgi:S1-C subfamily serine protease